MTEKATRSNPAFPSSPLPCPCAAITSVFAVQFGYDEDLAAGSVVITTFIGIVVLPLCAMALTMMM